MKVEKPHKACWKKGKKLFSAYLGFLIKISRIYKAFLAFWDCLKTHLCLMSYICFIFQTLHNYLMCLCLLLLQKVGPNATNGRTYHKATNGRTYHNATNGRTYHNATNGPTNLHSNHGTTNHYINYDKTNSHSNHDKTNDHSNHNKTNDSATSHHRLCNQFGNIKRIPVVWQVIMNVISVTCLCLLSMLTV